MSSIPVSRQALTPGADGLRLQIATAANGARAAGALLPIATQLECVNAGGVDYVLRQVDSLRHKPVSAPPAEAKPHTNPFLPYDAALYVAHLPPRHVVLLNRYPVVEPHLLLVTEAFEPQSAPLTRGDCEAAAQLLGRLGGLVFYNAGAIAGGSQPHRHLQWIDSALVPGASELPVAARVAQALAGAAPGVALTAELPYRHQLSALPSLRAADMHATYRMLLHALDRDPDAAVCEGYNALITPHWMMLVPRTRAAVADISINALGFAGALLLRDAAQVQQLKALGIAAVLQAATR